MRHIHISTIRNIVTHFYQGCGLFALNKYQQNPSTVGSAQEVPSKDMPFYKKVLIFGSLITLFAGFNVFAVPFFISSLRRFGKIPFLSSTPRQVSTLFELLPSTLVNSSKVPVFVDLGSGDGRLVIEAAKRGFDAVGYEINPWLVWYARRKAKSLGLENNAKFVYFNVN